MLNIITLWLMSVTGILFGLTQTELTGMNDRQTLGEQFYQHLKPYYERAFNGVKQLKLKSLSTRLTSILAFISALPPSLMATKPDYIVFAAFDTSENQVLVRSLEESGSEVPQAISTAARRPAFG